MKKFDYLILLSLFFKTHSLMASEFNLGFTSSNNLYLEGASCEELNKQAAQICQWKKNSDKNQSTTEAYKTAACSKAKGNILRLTVAKECIHSFALEVMNKKVANDGPNCWGTAMSFHALSAKPRFVWAQEMRYWNEQTPICHKLDANESPRPGDIINVYSPEYLFDYDVEANDAGIIFWQTLFSNRQPPLNKYPINTYSGFHRLLHSETYISDKIVFGKDSPSKLDKFNFRLLLNAYGRPRDDKDCQENSNLAPHFREYNNTPKNIRGSKCAYFTQVYRCENIFDYLKEKQETPAQANYIKEISSLDSMNTQLFGELYNAKINLTSTEVEILKLYAKSISDDAKIQLKQPNLIKLDEMIHTQRYFSSEAILKYLDFFDLM